MGPQPTVEDVARAAGVSRQTVSNVVNTPAIVKFATRERVQEVITALGYRPNLSARRIRQRKSSTLAIRLDPMRNGISGAVLDRFVHALTEHADRRGMRVLLFTADSPDREIDQIRALHDGADVDAFVLTATFYGDPRTEWLIAHEIPFVTFGRPWGIDDMNDPQHLWVDIDGRGGVADATAHLVDQGARRIGWVGWPSPSGTGDDRRRGWEEVMRDRLGASDHTLDELSIETHDSVPAATAAVSAMLARGPVPDALVCASDSLALGALIAASSIGLSALPIVGFDNTPVAEAVGLSSVEQRLDDVASAALELLLGATGGSVVPREITAGEAHRLISPALVLRKPTGLPLATPSESSPTAAAHHRKETP